MSSSKLETSMSLSSVRDLELNGVETFTTLDGGSSTGNESTCSDAGESIASYDGVSETTDPTEATDFDDNGHGDRDHTRGPMHFPGKNDQGVHGYHPHITPHESIATIVPVIHSNWQPVTESEAANIPPAFTEGEIDMDQLREQEVVPAGPYHQCGFGGETPGPDAKEASGNGSNQGQLYALWRPPKDGCCERREAIDEVERLVPGPTSSRHLQGATTTPHGTEVVSGPFMAAMGGLGAEVPSNTARDEPLRTAADWKASPSPSDAARRARMNITEGKILRMMPPSCKIHFDIDMKSFWQAGFHRDTTDRIEDAARMVVREFGRHDLGITFAYTPGPGRKVFRIRYDPSIGGDTLAQAFFPSDPRERWQVRVSYRAAVSWAFGGRLECMHNILAHEFMHILGFRHWNAGFDVDEMQLPSVHLPGTTDGDWKSVMYTSVHDRLWFNREDYRAIQKVYKAPSGDIMGDCLIVDVDPYV